MDLQTILAAILSFLNTKIAPFLMGLAALAFFWNMMRYFIMEGGNEEKHAEARQYALWSIAAFIIITSLWGIVNLLRTSLAIDQNYGTTSDYLCLKNGGCGANPNYGNEGRNYSPETNNPNYGNEGRNYSPETNNPNYSNEGRNYPQ